MEGHIHRDDLRLASYMVSRDANYLSHLAEQYPYQPHTTETIEHGSYYVPLGVENRQMAPNYVEYLAENAHGELSYGDSGTGHSFKPAESFLDMGAQKLEDVGATEFQEIGYLKPRHEETGAYNFFSTDLEILNQKQGRNEGHCTAALYHPKMKASASSSGTKPRAKCSRQRDTDRNRRLRINAALSALMELLPASKEGSKENVDGIIEYVKYLQLQMKELSQNRLGGVMTSNPFLFLEGYGHYILHEHNAHGPLEGMIGTLLEVNPLAARQLLESRGLFIMPMALAQGVP